MLQLKNINKSYKHKQVLRDINLTFDRGEIVFVLGESGCGKSTLLNIIGGLDAPDSGVITFDDRKVDHDDARYKSQHVAFVFQEHNLVSGLTVQQNIALANSQYGNEWIATNTSKYNIKPNQKVQYLSGGESQRVALLRCLYKDATVILADEPTGSLDNKNRDKVLNDIYSLKSQNKIVIVVSHDEDSAIKYADRIIRLDGGVVYSDDKIDREAQVYNNDLSLISTHNTIVTVASNDNVDTNTLSPKSSNHNSRMYNDCILTRNAISKHWVRNLGIVILLSFFLSFVAQSWAIYAGQHSLDRELVRTSQTDMIDLYGYNWDIDAVSNISDVASVQSYYINKSMFDANTMDDGISSSSANGHGLTFGVNNDINGVLYAGLIQQVEIDDFWQARTMSNSMQGRWIAKPNEIIIAAGLAQRLFGTINKAIGQEIYIFPGYVDSLHEYEDIVATIVGVNYTTSNIPNTQYVAKPIQSQSTISFEQGCYTYLHSSLVKQVVSQASQYDYDGTPKSIEVYLKDYTKYASVVASINNIDDSPNIAISVYQAIYDRAVWISHNFGGLMLASALILSFILMVVIWIFIRIANKQRQYEMVVLKSLGYSRWRIFGLFVYDLLVGCIIALAISFVWDRLFIFGFEGELGNGSGLDYFELTSKFLTSSTVWLIAVGLCILGVLALTYGTIFGKVAQGLKKSKQ